MQNFLHCRAKIHFSARLVFAVFTTIFHRHSASRTSRSHSHFSAVSDILFTKERNTIMCKKTNPFIDACTSILADMERRTAIQRQLVESQKAMLEALRACNAKMERIACAHRGLSADSPQPDPQKQEASKPVLTEISETPTKQTNRRQVPYLVRIK
jgi:hypothetical protein